MVHYILRGQRLYFKKNVLFLSLKIVFVLANSVDPDEMLHIMQHFTWVFTVCQSTGLRISGPQRVKHVFSAI